MKTLAPELVPHTYSEKILSEKSEILRLLHSFCEEREIMYFAVEHLARIAQEGQILTDEKILQPWKIAMVRSDYRRFKEAVLESELQLKQNKLELSELTCKETGDTCIYLEVYDYLPAQLKANQLFLTQVQQAKEAYMHALEKDPRKAGESYQYLCELVQSYDDNADAVMVAPLLGKGAPQLNQALIFPTKNRKINNVLLRVPKDCTIWTAKGNNQLGLAKLQILQKLDLFCKKRGLSYFAISKLEVGSRMYGALLPDFGSAALEVGMLREEYNFLKHQLDFAGEEFQVYETDKFGRHDGALRITLKSYVKSDARPNAVISVLPYDFLPQDEQERKDFLKSMKKLNTAYTQAIKYEAEHPDEEPKAHGIYCKILTEATRYNDVQEAGVRRICRIQCKQSKILPYHYVYPTVRAKINDFEINCPCNPYIWSDKTDINYNAAASTHKAEILSRLNRLCQEHEVTTFAIANLLIGVVTYQDFVPNHPDANWDLALLRNDYDKLLTILRSKAADYDLRFEEYRDSACRVPRATKIVELKELTALDGAIRLIPFDKVPEAYDTQYGFLKKMRRKNKLFKELTNYQMEGNCSLSEGELRKAYKKYGSDPLNKLYQEIDQLAQTYNQDPDSHLYGRVAVEKSKFIPEDELFPLEQAFLRDVAVNRPHDYSTWTPVIDEALHFQVTSIQQADLILIDKVDEICRKLDIGYFICGGSMLGYERNGGIIPWDDDIDVAMLRSDYDRFIKEAGPLLDDRFFLQTRNTDPHIPYLFSKIRLNNTEYITKYNEHRAFHKGICLDIFPFDFIPNDPEEQDAFREEVLALSKAHNRIVNNQMPEPVDAVKPRNLQEYYYRLYGKLKRLYFRCHSLKKSQKAYLDKATSLNGRAEELGLTTVASFVPSYTYIKLEDLLPYQDVMFNGHRVKVPKRPDIFLTMQYGDYLQLPPKHNQVAHRLLRWSVDVKADEQKAMAAATQKR